MTEWFIADTHFRHKNILNFEERPYDSVEEMEMFMIKAWNKAVGKNDTVYVIGDFCFGKEKAWIEILDQLKGNITLIKGNHDHHKVINKVLDAGYIKESYEVGKLIRYNDYELYLTHFPLELGERPKRFNLSGHIHNEKNTHKDQINVGVDSSFMLDYYLVNEVPFGTPVSIDYIDEYLSVLNVEIIKNYEVGK